MFSTKNIWTNENISTVRKESLHRKCSLKHDAIKEEAETFHSINAANFKTSNCRGSIRCKCAQPFNKPCRYPWLCQHRDNQALLTIDTPASGFHVKLDTQPLHIMPSIRRFPELK